MNNLESEPIKNFESEIATIRGIASQGRSVIVFEPELFSINDILAMLNKYRKLIIKSNPKEYEYLLKFPNTTIDADYLHLAADISTIEISLKKRKDLKDKYLSWIFNITEEDLSEKEFITLSKLYLSANITPLPRHFFSNKNTATILVQDLNQNIQGAGSILFLNNKSAIILAGFLQETLQGQGISHKAVFECLTFMANRVNFVYTMTNKNNRHVVRLYKFFDFKEDPNVKWVVLKKEDTKV